MRLVPRLILGLAIIAPVKTGFIPYLLIKNPLIIKKQESSPPFIALQMVNQLSEKSILENAKSDKYSLSTVAEHYEKPELQDNRVDYASAMVLEEMEIIQQEPSRIDEIAGLSPNQKERLELAQKNSKLLDQDWKEPTYSDYASEVLSKAGVAKEAISALNQKNIQMSGDIEFQGGLGLTDDNSMNFIIGEHELSSDDTNIDIKKGTYTIHSDESGGLVQVIVKDKDGNITGKGSAVAGNSHHKKIPVRSTSEISGTIAWYGNMSGSNKSPTTLLAIDSTAQTTIEESGKYTLEGLSKDSSALLSFTKTGYRETVALSTVDHTGLIQMLPESMCLNIFDIVSDQLKMTLGLESASIVWGIGQQNTKPMAGLKVSVEGNEQAIVVYLNVFNIPDTKLKETSENGRFIILGLPQGLHQLLVTKSDNYYSYENIYVTDNKVTNVSIDKTAETYLAPVRTYDAFHGSPVPASVQLQNQSNTLEIGNDGFDYVQSEQNSKLLLGYLDAGNKYERAMHVFNESDGKFYFPSVSSEWLRQIRALQKIDDIPNTGTIIIFMPSVAAYIEEATVYFDSKGIPTDKPVIGGGAILMNQETGVHEVRLKKVTTGVFGSRVLPIDEGYLTTYILNEF